ncbi:glycosyltransferase family 2 protein [Agromyces sp. MMS24-K17]|uniref:glycosyltransferase family 2 protein n=1 Tax=Agromyces sp. MMS24-K17 TaxID=3372850 RepID=UPI003755118B
MSGINHAVILNWRDAPATHRCLASVLSDDGIDVVWLVDNQSDGELRPLADVPRVRLIEVKENRGFASGVNLGLKEAIERDATAVLVINNDATLDPGSLLPLTAALECDPTLGAVAPLIRDDRDGMFEAGSTLSSTCKVRRSSDVTGRTDFLTWACILLRADTLRDVGLLDERYFMYWEDVEFGYRARDHGWNLGVEPSALARHATSTSHATAGGAIAMYSAAGLVTFARSQRGILRIAGLGRAIGRLVRSIANLDAEGADWVWWGIRMGWRAESPLYPTVDTVVREHGDVGRRRGIRGKRV